MKTRLGLFFAVVSAIIWFSPSLVTAQDVSDAFNTYSNPHAICDYYRTSAPNFVVVRESDTECLVSIGSGPSKGFTQYYYSGNDWCYKLYSGSEVVSSLCVKRPSTTAFDLTGKEPYIVVGVVVLVFVVVISSITAHKPPTTPVQAPTEELPSYTPPQSVRSKVRKPNKRGRIWRELSQSTKLNRRK